MTPAELFTGKLIGAMRQQDDQTIELYLYDDEEAKTGRFFYLTAEGDCCAQSFFTDLEIQATFPAKITEWRDVEGYKGVDQEDGDYRDTAFVKIITTKGYIDFTLHTDHNGYYYGWYGVEETIRWVD